MAKSTIIFEPNKLAIDLLPGEHVLNVQRQHWIALGMLFFTHALIIISLFVIVILMYVFKVFPHFPDFALYTVLLFFSSLALVGTYTCMTWYYTYYTVTTRRFIIRQYFKVIGAYYQEMLLRRGVEIETRRVTANIFYDLLDIEDIYITLHTEDVPEPFTFKTPQHPEQIEAALVDIETQL